MYKNHLMKNILFVFLLLSTALYAQKTDKKWDEVVALEAEGKTKSASEIVAKIYKNAMADHDDVQIIKCFFYQSKYIQVLEENAQTKILNNLKKETTRVSNPSKAILNLVYAESLNGCYTLNEYKIKQRTNIDTVSSDFLTWSEKNFTEEINKAMKATLENEALLKKTPLTKYESIFDYSSDEKFQTQNLYEYLLKENIEFYTSKIHNWEIQKSSFLNYKKDFYGRSAEFTKLNLDFVTNPDLKLVLSLYQKQEINNSTAENQFVRIQFCKNSLFGNDDDYINALVKLQKSTKDEIVIQKIQLEKATILSQQASKELHPDYHKKAVAALDSILAVKNRSNAYKSGLLLKQNTLSKSLNIQLQKYTYTTENTRAYILYKNIQQLTVSFYKINTKQLAGFNNLYAERDSIVSKITRNKKPEASVSYSLKNKNDYFQYSTEIILPNLQTGTYLVYFESESDIADQKAFAYETVTSSNFSVLASQNNAREIFQVLDRKTGKPLENVNIKSQSFEIKTDKNGIASYKKKKDTYNEITEFTLGNDTLSITKSYVQYNRNYETEKKEDLIGKVEFYLDRAIYRPGQTVFYKGIAIQKTSNVTSVVPKTSFEITIEDASGSEIKKFNVITNEFGSFWGEFTLPKEGLTGTFKIEAEEPYSFEQDASYNSKKEEHPFWDFVELENSKLEFKVEEYKRPKFEVVFEPKKESFQVNKPIKVNGTAKAFAGSSISDAKVTYTVTRFVSYSRNYFGREDDEEIADGETKTDASGKFVIDFTAEPEEFISKEKLPVFTYEIEVSVTDINGETHTSKTEIKVGYHDLILDAAIPNEIQTKNKNEISLTSTNLNDEFLAVKGELKIYYVQPFSNKFKKRVWPKPEIETISDADFEKLFPFEDNNNPLNKPEEILVYSKKINTETDKKIALDFASDYKSGTYKIVFSANDSFNNPIEAVQNFKLTQSKEKYNTSKLFTTEQINPDPKKDGFVVVKLTSVIPELYITAAGHYENNIFFDETSHLLNHETIVKIPLKNGFEKSVKLGFESIFENQPFREELTVILKNITPKLEWKIESFRNKIQPGSDEKWSFQLMSSNAKKEAEVLASMYDSSLDKFTTQRWNGLELDKYIYNYGNEKSKIGFQNTNTTIKNLNSYIKGIKLNNEAISLMWFGFNFNNQNSVYLQNQYIKQLNRKIKKPADAKLVSGVITDEKGQEIPGCSISIKNTKRTAFSDFDGYYEIEAAKGEEIVFSFIGFKSQSFKVTDARVLNIIFEEDSSQLQEVVVTGYGIQKKQSITGSISQFKISADITNKEDDSLILGPASMLAGKVMGVEITASPTDKLIIRGAATINPNQKLLYIIDGEIVTEEAIQTINASDILSMNILKQDKATALYGNKGANGAVIITTKKAMEVLTQVKARKNLSETAFFFPDLKTDSRGNLSFNFTSPEALTAWKLRLLAHNKNAVSGYLEKSVVTQKELMVLPNFPRFFREKDTILISAKISNMTDEAKTGIAMLQFFDAVTMKPVDAAMLNVENTKNFAINPFGNTTATWTITIPEGLQGVQYKIVAKAGNFADGEENIIPVLTNTMLVTESIPIWVRDNSKKEYTFENLKNNTSTTLKNHQFTFEYTSNPSWIAIQSLPYLMEYEHECAEQTFARFYANTLASVIISNNPKIEAVFENWRKNGKLNSKLETNEELKSIILAETPWLNDAKSEDEQKKNLSLLFDLEKMKTSQEAAFKKLKQKQKESGGFAWFDGGYESEYITRHVLAGLGHLAKLDKRPDNLNKVDEIAKTGIPYLDQKFLEYYKTRTKNLKKGDKLIWLHPNIDLHSLYARSFYLDKYPLSDTLKKASKLYLESAKKDWLSYSLYEKGLAALTLNRFGEKETAKKIIESLKETSSTNEDWGMYWISNTSGWYWYEAPIETQALLIEAFAEVNNDTKSIDAMKVWLLKNKQTKNWPTTKSTTEAIYALLMQGTDWLSVKDNTVIKLGDEKIMTKKLTENEKEAETGYIKLNWKADEVKKEMATISIENKSKVPGFGGVYWQYFEDLDKIKNNSGTVLSVSKELYIKKSTLKGDQLEKITSKNTLQIGDLVTVRLIIISKEDTEYVHLKDMRASCFEPVNVLSEYKYKDGLGYYMSTKDTATHLFFDYINKGTYVLEYDIRVNNSGEFSNGITTIQSMYAPEFTSHTKGIRVKVQ
jgi:TonB-dependent SusC/RagA subfamily outer membrane receptor